MMVISILILIILLILLIIIDFYRRGLRIRELNIIRDIKNNSVAFLSKDKYFIDNNLNNILIEEYPLLKDGFLLFYFEVEKPIKLKKLIEFLEYYGIKYTNDNIFQKIHNKNVIYSILLDHYVEENSYNIKDDYILRIIIVMNYQKLYSINYNSKKCYDLMFNMLDDLINHFKGILMNEHKIRFTTRDKENYLKAILNFSDINIS